VQFREGEQIMDVSLPGALLTVGPYMPKPKYPRDAMVGRAAVGENERLRRELERISIENRNLARELARLKDAHEDLSESALIWIRMYERQLDRANRALAGSLHAPGAGKQNGNGTGSGE
jgi:hypothetical protein